MAPQPTNTPAARQAQTDTKSASPEKDTRFTYGLLYDVVAVLRDYGYVLDENTPAMAKTMLALAEVVKAFEGRS